MWGHPTGCSCTLCPSIERLHRVVGLARVTPRFVDYATVRIRNVIGELSDFLESHPEEREDLARPPPQEGGKGAGREVRGEEPAPSGKEEERQAEKEKKVEDKKASEAATSGTGGAGDHHPG